MNDKDIINKIHSFGWLGSRLGLERMNKLLELLGNPQRHMKVIHVTGTNGKGSVCRFIYSILQKQGYNVGLYTSPFLERFTERIEYNGMEISKNDLVQCALPVFEAADHMVSRGFDSPTEFEIVTAIAFNYYKKKEMDYLVLEVGLGGRGDATNIIEQPIVSVITTISLEHTQYLGDSLSKIAFEKAGIIKHGCPAVTSVRKYEALKIIEKTSIEKKCLLSKVPLHQISNIRSSLRGYAFDFTYGANLYPNLETSMIGRHQIENAATAVTTAEVLKKQGVHIDKRAMYEGIKVAKQNGRFEVISQNPFIIIDGAHNTEGITALRDTLSQLFEDEKILLCIGMMKDKNISEIIDTIMPSVQEIIVTEPENDRKMDAYQLCEMIQKHKKTCIPIPDIIQACEKALKRSPDFDVILFTGSLYLIGKVRGYIRKIKDNK